MPRSGIREIMDLAQRPGVIHLEIGQPDFPTPAHIVAAANHAAERGHIGYTANAGLPELCEALAAKLHQDNGVRVATEQVIVTIGAMGALYGSLLSVLEPGDQLLVPDPGYPNYRMTAELCGAESVPYPLPAADGYQPDLDALAAAISPRTKAIVVGSPSNPTGTVIHRDRLQGIVELAERHDLYLVSDECYEKIVFDGRHVSPASLGAADRCFTAGSFSKSYAMTGWRVGYVACPKPIVPLLVKLQEATVSCAPVLSQHAALAALAGPQECVAGMVKAYRERRDLACELLMSAGLCTVDRVRRAEHRRLAGADDQRLKGSRYRWLTNPENMDEERWEQFAELRDSALQTARAWGYKEHAMTLWAYRSRAWARKAWLAWYRSAVRCRLEPVKRVARMIKRHLDGIVTAVVDKVTNARAESINAGIQKVKYSARGFRNRKRFRNAIYFHLGGLDLYPVGVTR